MGYALSKCITITHGPYRGTSPIRNSPPPPGFHRALGIFLLQGPRGALFLMGEAPLYCKQYRRDIGGLPRIGSRTFG